MPTTYWYDGDEGDDDNDGLSRDTPKKTFVGLLKVLEPGDTFITTNIKSLFEAEKYTDLYSLLFSTQLVARKQPKHK